MRAAESTHWYTPQGEPMYDVPAVKGGKRPTTLRDARKLGLVPSVTTIIRCAASPALETWKQNQVLLAALTLPRRDGESDESFCERIMRDSQEQARKARDRGTQIHAAVQGHFEGKPPSEEMWAYVQGVRDLLQANCAVSDWVAEKAFAHPDGFGGKCDLSCNAWVIDFKTKEFGPEEAPTLKTWDEHAMQLAAYREGLADIDNVGEQRCGIVYVSTTHPGLARLVEIDEQELRRGWLMFESLLKFWQSKNNYFPAMAQAA